MTGIDLEGFEHLTDAQRTALELGDPDAMLELFAKELQEEGEQAAAAETTAKTDETPAAAADGGAPSGAAAEGAAPEEEGAFVETKDGKHRIPYSELQTAREQARQFKALYEQTARENELTKQERSQLQQMLDQMNRKVDLLKGQVTDAGKEPAKLPEEIRLTDDMLASLKEYGEAGEAIIALANELSSIKTAVKPAQPDAADANTDAADVDAEVEAAITANADLSAWRTSDPEKWAVAVKFDNALRLDPDYADQSFEERFAEVARMTRARFGITEPAPASGKTAQQLAQEKIDLANQQAAAPKSLSALGRASSQSETDIRARINEMTEEQALEFGANLSLDDLEKLLD